ncbi:DUF488 domain-containing protein [Prevotella dentasini JCM 15908]
MMMTIRIKRAYAPADAGDGFRVLVDRLWPRGLGKEKARIDLWEKRVAPSRELRKWFGHAPGRFPKFAERYRAELAANAAYPDFLAQVCRHEVVTLVYAAHDEEHNNAVVLRDSLLSATAE